MSEYLGRPNYGFLSRPIKIYWAVVVSYGRSCPEGHLPVYSVDTEREAEELIDRYCELVWIDSLGTTGYIAQELEREQTLENLYAFGHRLDAAYREMKEERLGRNSTIQRRLITPDGARGLLGEPAQRTWESDEKEVTDGGE